jgi:hypothetical protein
MVIKAVSLSEVSEMAIVPDKECKMPTLMVSELLLAGADVACVSVAAVLSDDFEHPVSDNPPITAAIHNEMDIILCCNMTSSPI